MNYKNKALEYLLNKYEKSKLRANTNVVNITIKAKIGSIFPNYLKPEVFQQYDIVHEELKELEELDYIELIWEKFRKDYILKEAILNIEKIDEIYQFLDKLPKTLKEQQAIELCNRYLHHDSHLDLFLSKLIKDLEDQKSVKKFIDLDNLSLFQEQLDLMDAIVNNKNEYYIRELSMELFHDSKIAQKHIGKVITMIKECFYDMDGFSNDEILEEFNIYKNPSWIKIKGINCLDNPSIDVNTFINGISFSSKDISLFKFNYQKEVKNVITVENETSFERIDGNDPDNLYLYLAGFHNSSKRNFLINLYQAYPNATYHHFGDIDCGGFRIYKHLCQKTNIPFKPLMMDLETLSQHQNYGKKLEGEDRKNLDKMILDPFFLEQTSLFQFMLKKDIKLEQECIVLNKNEMNNEKS